MTAYRATTKSPFNIARLHERQQEKLYCIGRNPKFPRKTLMFNKSSVGFFAVSKQPKADTDTHRSNTNIQWQLNFARWCVTQQRQNLLLRGANRNTLTFRQTLKCMWKSAPAHVKFKALDVQRAAMVTKLGIVKCNCCCYKN